MHTELEEGRAGAVHEHRREATVGKPVAPGCRLGPVPVEPDQVLDDRRRQAGLVFARACALDLRDAAQRLVGRGARVDLADVHTP
jgi:hypothetical protein